MKKRTILITLFIATTCLSAIAQWSDNPAENNLITPVNGEIYSFDLGVTNNGNVYITYIRPMGGSSASVFQIIDTDGNMLFSDEGLVVSHKQTLTWVLVGDLLLVDRDGNAIIAVTDCRNSYPEPHKISYTMYKVSPSGEMLWGEDGVELVEGMAFDFVACMKIIQIEDGSYICAWTIIDAPTNQSFVQMQRISPTGELLWNENETPDFGNNQTSYPYLVNAGNNQVIIVYTRGAGNYLTARKIDFDGSNVWPEELFIYRGGFTIPPLQGIIRVISDQMGGAFVGWYDDRYSTLQECTYISHVKSNGTFGFSSGEGGERVGYSDYFRGFAPAMYFDKDNSVLYVAYRETSSGQSWQQLTAQKISIPSGELLWDIEGKGLIILDQGQSVSNYSVRENGNGDIAIFFQSSTTENYAWDINSVILIDSDGNDVWENRIVQFATSLGFKGTMVSTPLINNSYWVVVWKDERKLNGETDYTSRIYMQRINIDGTLGKIETVISYSTNSSFEVYIAEKMINIINPDNKYIDSVQLFDINGKMIGNYSVKRSDNVLIPAVVNEKIAIVKIIGQNEIETHKVLNK